MIEPSCNPDPDCGFCHGTGEADSGGFTPWDAPISVRCSCTYPKVEVLVEQMVEAVCQDFRGRPLTQVTGDQITFVILNKLLEMRYQGHIAENCRCAAHAEILPVTHTGGVPTMRITARYIPAWELKYKEVVRYLH
jgi:hypothetical protein